MAIALLVGALSFFGVSLNLISADDLANAKTVYPEVQRGIELIQAGQIGSGLLAIASVLLIYFRVFATTKLIPQSLKKAA